MRLAIIGCGHWGKILAKKFEELDCRVVKYDEDENKGWDVYQAPTWGALNAITNDVEAVLIATPNNTHYTLALDLLRLGKHVWVEKPLAVNYVQAKTLVELSEEKNLILMVNHQLIYHQAVQRLKMKCLQHKPIQIISTRLGWNPRKQEENVVWNLAPHSLSIIGELIEDFDDIKISPFSVQNFGNYVHLSGILNNTGIICEVASNWPKTERRTIATLKGNQTYCFDENTNTIRGWLGDKEICDMAFYDDDPLKEACKDFIDSIKEKREPLSSARKQLKVYGLLGGE